MFNLGELYYTRNNKPVILDGVSDYVIWGQNERILTGNIDGISHSWNGDGQLLVSKLFLNQDFNDLDLLINVDEIEDPKIWVGEFDKKGKLVKVYETVR